MSAAAKVSVWRQPAQVWAVAFACVIAFMGIGLVDPILKSIAANLDATPSEVSLLFTSYLLVTAIAMLITSKTGASHCRFASAGLAASCLTRPCQLNAETTRPRMKEPR